MRSVMSASESQASGVLQVHSVARDKVRTVEGEKRKQWSQVQEQLERDFNAWPWALSSDFVCTIAGMQGPWVVFVYMAKIYEFRD